mmetsp:Transcript_24304/g.35349  ORF Transcript_24304/g.35349 Transcript_24304/m.35349 type:complete len:160 (-) Transcript_24304:176-655(-)
MFPTLLKRSHEAFWRQCVPLIHTFPRAAISPIKFHRGIPTPTKFSTVGGIMGSDFVEGPSTFPWLGGGWTRGSAPVPASSIDLTHVDGPTNTEPLAVLQEGIQDILQNLGTWFIKRTYQPNVLRRRRRWGFLKRVKTTKGLKIVRRRLKKGRKRIAIHS